jgi:hypothetical protein
MVQRYGPQEKMKRDSQIHLKQGTGEEFKK